jgi:uridine kinase
VEIETDVNDVVNNWRSVIKHKRRMIFTFGERADIRLNATKSEIYPTRIPLDTWEIQECY